MVVENAPEVINQLLRWGVDFDRENNEFHLTREGGHSQRRVLHVADATGRAITEKLTAQVLDHPNIELINDRLVIDLVNLSKLGRYPSRCAGAYALNRTIWCCRGLSSAVCRIGNRWRQ